MTTLLRSTLENSLQEKQSITLWVQSIAFKGVVTQLQDEFVEIRQSPARTVVRLDRIDAVSQE